MSVMTTVRTKTLVTSAIFAFALVVFSAREASAQNPFSIDGIVQTTNVGTTNNSGRCRDGSLPVNGVCPLLAAPTPQALSTPDPSSNSKEIGPANGSTQQLGVINLAQPPMLANTSINLAMFFSGRNGATVPITMLCCGRLVSQSSRFPPMNRATSMPSGM